MKEKAKLQKPRNWRRWGPYVSDRQWGTVREDYSAGGDAWNYISHDAARSKAYRWGEEGIGGISDSQQILCMAPAFWNGKDPILKERLFGLTNNEGNHGEDVKELYYYLDNVPTHSYMKMLYKYPQQAFPYQWLLDENRQRTRQDPEFELLDTGIFNEDDYFDIFIEYAKNDEHDILVQYTIHNRSGKEATLHLLPTLWYRNTPDWEDAEQKPVISVADKNTLLLETKHLGNYYCYAETDTEFLFTNNETNNQRLYQAANEVPYVKDGINDFVVNGNQHAINPQQSGTKAAAHYILTIAARQSMAVKLRLTNRKTEDPFHHFDDLLTAQKDTADEFYNELQQPANGDEKLVQRQAWAGMLWSKQFYYYNVNKWLNGDKGQPPPPATRKEGRNSDWKHMMAADIISMPDKWEYPWFAAWDLAFHCITFAAIDPVFAKEQLLLLLGENYQHPNGQLPAYEWNFSDVNPPVHALAAWRIYKKDAALNGKPDTAFLQRVFHKLLLNFTWWVNRKDHEGNNIFEGGFLGLDNIGVFDRSKPLPGGGTLEQADGTSWMALYCLNMISISVELSEANDVYEDLAIKFGEHFFYIAGSMANMANIEGAGLWDEADGFYYDMLRMPDNSWSRLKLRTLVGLIPLIAVEVIEEKKLLKLPRLVAHINWFISQRPDLANLISNWEGKNGEDSTHLLSLLRGHRMKSLLRYMLNESEFLSAYGIRSLSKIYAEQPFNYWLMGEDFSVRYNPAESDTSMFGGNSNWRGPIWMPLNYLLVQAMYRFYEYYGDDFTIEMPSGSGNYTTIKAAADAVKQRIAGIFLKDKNGRRAVWGDNEKLQTDEHFKDYMLFHEYFNGDTGMGLGAAHQTGWTGLIALMLQRG